MDYLPIIITVLAGLSTAVGGLIALMLKNMKFCYLCVVFGFSAGVMIFVSFTSLLNFGIENVGIMTAFLSFFGGMFLIYLIDVSIPHTYLEEKTENKSRIKRTALLLFLGLTIHNFPEGMAVLFSSYSNLSFGIMIAIAIALHNIPEGIAISMPIMYATKNRKKAFLYSLVSGIAEPAGAVISMFFLYQFLNQYILGILISAVAGTMIFISFDELLPYVYNRGGQRQHLSILGLFLGMFVMSLTVMFV
jgi:zinc transporter, ZIP family